MATRFLGEFLNLFGSHLDPIWSMWVPPGPPISRPGLADPQHRSDRPPWMTTFFGVPAAVAFSSRGRLSRSTADSQYANEPAATPGGATNTLPTPTTVRTSATALERGSRRRAVRPRITARTDAGPAPGHGADPQPQRRHRRRSHKQRWTRPVRAQIATQNRAKQT